MVFSIIKSLILPQDNPYVSGGMGIVERYKSNKTFWDKHFELSRSFQRNNILEASTNGRIIVYGAGRLFDLAQDVVIDNFSEVVLVDADPVAKIAWRKFIKTNRDKKTQIQGEIVEITGAIKNWSRHLAEQFRSRKTLSEEALAECIASVLAVPTEPWSPPLADCAISLNLMGQIPLVWRDAVLDLVEQCFPNLLDQYGMVTGRAKEALVRTMRELQIVHLEQLKAAQPKRIIIISDDEFYFYTEKCAEWEVEKALFISDMIPPSGYKVSASNSWLWHIAREGIEEDEFGSIHRIIAFCLDKN